MAIRPGDRATDLAAITELTARYETAWFGAPEQDLVEVTETMGRIADWSRDVRLAYVDGRLGAAAWRWQHDLDLLVDPATPGTGPVVRALLNWLMKEHTGRLQVLDRDERLRAELAGADWRPERSAFGLARAVTDDWTVPPARWPAGVEPIDYRPGHAAAVHRLVYVEAGWSSIAGHQERDLDEWHSLFLAEHTAPQPPLVAWRAQRPVGVALTRTFSDGTGWVSQLAVARGERGRGLGRALLREALGRLAAVGATRLALGVQAANAGALGLYLDAGLRIDREYLYYAPPGDPDAPRPR